MKTKIKFLKMIWRVLRNKEQGWIFFKLSDEDQKTFLENTGDIDVKIQYLGVDIRVVKKVAKRLETPIKKDELKRGWKLTKTEKSNHSNQKIRFTDTFT